MRAGLAVTAQIGAFLSGGCLTAFGFGLWFRNDDVIGAAVTLAFISVFMWLAAIAVCAQEIEKR